MDQPIVPRVNPAPARRSPARPSAERRRSARAMNAGYQWAYRPRLIAPTDRNARRIGLTDESLSWSHSVGRVHRLRRLRSRPASRNRVISDRHQHAIVSAVERSIDRANERARQRLDEIGRDLRMARVTRGLSQSVVAGACGIAQSQLSEIERGRHRAVALEILARLAGAVGLELSVKLYPGGQPVRDNAHIALLGRFRRAVGEGWAWAAEVPLPIPGDKRGWDRMLRAPGS